MEKKKRKLLPVIALLATLAMVGVNALAGFPIINGVTTAYISDLYPSLFTPAGLTFAIWGVIYLSLLVFAVLQLVSNKYEPGTKDAKGMTRIRVLYIISCGINIVWLLLWQYNQIAFTVLLMFGLLACLLLIMQTSKGITQGSTLLRVVKIAFGLYLGWITVATIANITVFLVSVQWNAFGISPQLVTVFILAVGAVIGSLATVTLKNVAYGLVMIWAYFGIVLQHLPSGIHGGQYPMILVTLFICMALFAVCTVLALLSVFKKKEDSGLT